jgi:hypothetical protein
MESRKAEVDNFYHERLIKYLNTGDDAYSEGLFAPDFKWLVPGTGESVEMPVPPGDEGTSLKIVFMVGIKTVIRGFNKAFKDFKVTFQKLIPEDGGENIVAGRCELTGIT